VSPPKNNHKCPPHHFMIDSDSVGHCKHCPAEKDFGKLLTREGVYVAAGRRGAKARKESLGKKRGRKKKGEILCEKDYFSG